MARVRRPATHVTGRERGRNRDVVTTYKKKDYTRLNGPVWSSFTGFDRLAKLSREYLAYIRGPQWRARRIAYWQTHERRCADCGWTAGLDLHHLTYKRFGNEADEDLLPLCRTCHDKRHEGSR